MSLDLRGAGRDAVATDADRAFVRLIGLAGLAAETRRRNEMAETTIPQFDPVAYKQTTREQWQQAADAWHRWGPRLEEWLGEATEVMLDLARIGPGDRVLDVAAGAGGQSIAAARRVGLEGSVLATDISSNILDYAEQEARRAGLENVATRVMDGEEIEVGEGVHDAVISRVGLIYFPDQQRALAGMRRALKPGGRVAAIVYSTPERNQFFSIPVSIIRRRAELPPPAPGQPGPFSLGAEGVLASAYEEAGFREVETRLVPAPLRLASAAECVRFERESFGALHQMLAGLDQAAREQAWAEIERELGRFEGPAGFEGPCELLVAAATK
jgi:ubiquinone/menaquinone biosynthesis C-methylase UbiE